VRNLSSEERCTKTPKKERLKMTILSKEGKQRSTDSAFRLPQGEALKVCLRVSLGRTLEGTKLAERLEQNLPEITSSSLLVEEVLKCIPGQKFATHRSLVLLAPHVIASLCEEEGDRLQALHFFAKKCLFLKETILLLAERSAIISAFNSFPGERSRDPSLLVKLVGMAERTLTVEQVVDVLWCIAQDQEANCTARELMITLAKLVVQEPSRQDLLLGFVMRQTERYEEASLPQLHA
jgi:hypothetical protein